MPGYCAPNATATNRPSGFDLLILRRQLAQLEGDAVAVAAERIREKVQHMASNLLTRTNIPAVAAQQVLLDEVADDQWWVDVTLLFVSDRGADKDPRRGTRLEIIGTR